MPTVLLITYDYPPGYHVGAERMVKFEKYLPHFGFRTCVLTKGSKNQLPMDPAQRVYRAFDPGQIYRSTALRFKPRGSLGHQEQRSDENYTFFGRKLLGESLSWIKACTDLIAIPDPQIAWLPAAIWMGFKAINREKADVILSSSRPETVHILAAILSKKTGIPWVADFRDGWIFEPLKSILRGNNLRQKIEQKLETWVTSQAEKVVSVSPPITEYFCDTFPALEHKFITIPNGYDPEDWQDVQPRVAESHRFRLVYTGRLGLSRPNLDPGPFLHALQALPEAMKSKIEVLWVGELAERERDQLFKWNLGGIIRVIGPVSRQESLAYQKSADCLLLIVGKDKSVITSKLFEYLYARRPILAISASNTAAAAIIRQIGAGEVVDPDDSKAISACLNRFYLRWQNRDLDYPVRGIECFERRELTRQMAEILKSVVSSFT